MTITTEAPATISTARKAEVPLNGFRAALSAHLLTVGKDQLMPMLTGVKITVSGGVLRMESTDRYRLTVTEQKLSEPGEEFVALIFGDDVARVFKTLPKPMRGMRGGGVVFLSADGFELSVGSYDGSVTARLGAVADYPRLQPVVDGYVARPAERFGINPTYLAALAKMPRDKNAPVVFDLNGSDKPSRSKWTHEDVDFTHVIMPVRLA